MEKIYKWYLQNKVSKRKDHLKKVRLHFYTQKRLVLKLICDLILRKMLQNIQK
jgi:hypothetical protein